MLKISFCQLKTAFAISSLSILLGAFPGQSQRSDADLTETLLDGADCVVSGSNGWSELDSDNDPISINRQVYNPLFYMRVEEEGFTTLSCRVDPERFSVLNLEFGVDDDSAWKAVRMTVNIYQGGELKHTYADMQAGSIARTILALDDSAISQSPNNIAIEITDCDAQTGLFYERNCALQVTEARLLPTSTYSNVR